MNIKESILLDSVKDVERYLSLGWKFASKSYFQWGDGEIHGIQYRVMWTENSEPVY